MANSDPAAAQAFWTEIYGHWPLTAEEAANELHDWWVALDEVPKVYDELTRGRFTKPNTMAQYVIDAVRADQEADAATQREDWVAGLDLANGAYMTAGDYADAMQKIWEIANAMAPHMPQEAANGDH